MKSVSWTGLHSIGCLFKPLMLGLAVMPWLFFSGGCSKPRSASDDFTRVMNVGKSHYDGGAADRAIESFQKAVSLQPVHTDAHLNLANAYLLADQSENAIREADEVLKLDQNSAAAHYIRGCANLRLRRFEEAVKALQQAKAGALTEVQKGSVDDKTLNTVTFQLGRAFQEWGKWEDAARQFQEVVEFDSAHPAANYNLSQVLLRLNQQAEATEALERHRKLMENRTGPPPTVATYERCKFTEARVPFLLAQPATSGIKVVFADATREAFGSDATKYQGPLGVIDINHRGQNDLFVREGTAGFRVLMNSKGAFQAHGNVLPAATDAAYTRCLVGDLNNDRYEDVVVMGPQSLQAFRFATNGAGTDATAFSNLRELSGLDGGLVDLDFTGKLDLVLLGPTGTNLRVLRNLGNMYFTEITRTSGVPESVTSAKALLFEDWNGDSLLDLLVARADQAPMLLAKQRGGPLALTNTAPEWPAGSVLASGDLNNDLRPDLVIAGQGKLTCVFQGLTERREIQTGGSVTLLSLVDYDNDGWLDIVAGGNGLRVWRNMGQAGFQETSEQSGLAGAVKGALTDLVAADFDQDCDTDFLVSTSNQGLQFLRNNGGNSNRQLKLRLLGNRSNSSGLGVGVEVLAGNWRTFRTVQKLPVEIGVGANTQLDSVIVHWADLAPPIADIKVDSCIQQHVLELMLPTGSCPYLYAWDGEKFRFITDILGAAPLGLHLTDDRLIDADPAELVALGDESALQSRDGHYALQITEELREVLYLDEAKLVVVDHAPGTEVHPTCKLVPGKPWPAKEIMTLRNRRPLLKATTLDDKDVTSVLAEDDQQLVSPAALRVPQLRGLAESHGVVLDFGPLETKSPLVLALTGWLRFGGGMANVGASHDPKLPFPFPRLEAELKDGQWQPVDVVVGAPAGKTKTILVELGGKLPAGSRRLRLTTAFEIHWDRIALFERDDAAGTKLTHAMATSSDLHWRGYSEMKNLPWSVPLTPDYDKVTPYAKWRITPAGWCTRYGEVDELIRKSDNALVLLNGGDELTLKFAAAQLPEKPAGAVRDFFLYAVGWDKDADVHVERGWTVDPLPWHGMDDQLYPKEIRPAFENDEWMEKYNTRWVGPLTPRPAPNLNAGHRRPSAHGASQ